MGLTSHLRKLAYPAIAGLLLPLVFAGGASAQPQPLPLPPPAAKYVGVDAYSTPTWTQVSDPGNTDYYAGPAESVKLFYKDGLPTSDADYANDGSAPGCGTQVPNGDTYVYPTSALCIITYNAVTSNNPNTDTNLQAFLNSTLTDPHHIILIFCNEPDNGPNDNKCMCDFATEAPCYTKGSSGTAAENFTDEFEIESQAVTNFENDNSSTPNDPNVQFAEDSYVTGNTYEDGANCNYIVPAQYVSYYLADVYEDTSGNNPVDMANDPGWTNWLSCTKNTGIDRGIAEFAINCGSEGTYDSAVAQSFGDDATYLSNNFNLEVWNLWDSGGCVLQQQGTLNDAPSPDSLAAWQGIENP